MGRVRFQRFKELEETVRDLATVLGLHYVKRDRLYVVVSKGSSTSAYARIWGTPRVLAETGACQPAYVIELVSENISRVSSCGRIVEILIHELLHIPSTFSGSLRSHGPLFRAENIRRFSDKVPYQLARRLCELVKFAVGSVAGVVWDG